MFESLLNTIVIISVHVVIHVVRGSLRQLELGISFSKGVSCNARRKEVRLTGTAVLVRPISHVTCNGWLLHRSTMPNQCCYARDNLDGYIASPSCVKSHEEKRMRGCIYSFAQASSPRIAGSSAKFAGAALWSCHSQVRANLPAKQDSKNSFSRDSVHNHPQPLPSVPSHNFLPPSVRRDFIRPYCLAGQSQR